MSLSSSSFHTDSDADVANLKDVGLERKPKQKRGANLIDWLRDENGKVNMQDLARIRAQQKEEEVLKKRQKTMRKIARESVKTLMGKNSHRISRSTAIVFKKQGATGAETNVPNTNGNRSVTTSSP